MNRTADNQVYLGEDGLVREVIRGDQTESSIKRLGDDTDQFTETLAAQGKPVRILVDAREGGNLDGGAQRQAKYFLTTRGFDRVAVFGVPAGTQVIANLIMQVSGQSARARLFDTEDQAIAWLREF